MCTCADELFNFELVTVILNYRKDAKAQRKNFVLLNFPTSNYSTEHQAPRTNHLRLPQLRDNQNQLTNAQ